MSRFTKLFRHRFSVLGMVHVRSLPGTPGFRGSVDEIIDTACAEAEIYRSCGIDGIILENMHDIPYVKSKHLKPETTAILTRICTEVKKILPANTPCGIQVLAGGNEEALAVAQASNLQFIRCEGFVFSHIADEGFMDACAGNLLRYRHSISADNVLILADIKKKHSSHAITADLDIAEIGKAANFCLADGVIITGQSTGDPANVQDLLDLKDQVDIPIIIGSGVTADNLHRYFKANAVIVGSDFKVGGCWKNDVCPDRVKKLINQLELLRQQEI